MAKKQFKDLASLEKYLTNEQLVNQVFKDKKVKSILAATMSQSVYRAVYGRYVPKEYKRRRNEGGLSDVRNMDFTKVEIKGNTIRILFENLTMGQTHYTPIYEHNLDSLHNQYITDTIVEGLDNWYQINNENGSRGAWAKPRDFISATVRNIKANPSYLINAIKDSYRKAGFTVK